MPHEKRMDLYLRWTLRKPWRKVLPAQQGGHIRHFPVLFDGASEYKSCKEKRVWRWWHAEYRVGRQGNLERKEGPPQRISWAKVGRERAYAGHQWVSKLSIEKLDQNRGFWGWVRCFSICLVRVGRKKRDYFLHSGRLKRQVERV